MAALLISSGKQKTQVILRLFKDVSNSDLTVKQYFEKHSTPIRISQYFRLKKRYNQLGVAGLEDLRHIGNARKIQPDKIQLVKSIMAYNRGLSSSELQTELQNQWRIVLSKRRIEQLRVQFKLPRIKVNPVRQEIVQFAGIEIISALAHHVGIFDDWERTIKRRLEQVISEKRPASASLNGDHTKARNSNGTFSARYNRLAKVRQTKFASITEKVKSKDFSRLSLLQMASDKLERRNLAILLLPLVTNNGATRNVNTPLGNALGYACGYNYKNATLDKYLRELKYLQVSPDLISCNARFWSQFWKQYDFQATKISCYYIDGNVRPLWSSKRCRKGKVTMLGRVMGCLEQVVIHDGRGRPIYLRTFSGNADLRKNALGTMNELDAILNEGKEPQTQKSHCSRALIIDGAGNAVQTLRAFSVSNYHYITILDTNQIQERKFKHIEDSERYQYGDGSLTDCRIELMDSTEPGYIYESRAVRVRWDNGKECCLVTSIPKSCFNASEVVKAYFDRWPYCERQYALMKASLCFYQIVGYGKKLVSDENRVEKIKKLQSGIRQLQQALRKPLAEIATEHEKLQLLFEKERMLKEKSKISKTGKREFRAKRAQKEFDACQCDIRKIQRKIKSIEGPFKKQIAALGKKSLEFARIQGKQKIYHADVELDQLMTSFRLTLANLLAFLVKEFLGNVPIEMGNLIQNILFLPGRIEHLPGRRVVRIDRNEKSPQFMSQLRKALSKLNEQKIKDTKGDVYEFELC